MLEAARYLRQEPVSFLLIGEGVEKRRLERRARCRAEECPVPA